MSNEEILEIKKQLEDHGKRISELEAIAQTKPELVTRKLSIKDFIRSKKPKDDIQKTLAIGYYLEKYEGFSSFNVIDLDKGFRDAKQTVPPNINDKVNKSIDKQYIMRDKKEKNDKLAWRLTADGEEYVENDFTEKK